MSEKDAIAIAVNAILSGKRRDLYSGGIGATVFVVDANGVRQIPKEKVDQIEQEVMPVQ